jgi:hypothetical protein
VLLEWIAPLIGVEPIYIENSKFQTTQISSILSLIQKQKGLVNVSASSLTAQGSEISNHFLKELMDFKRFFKSS